MGRLLGDEVEKLLETSGLKKIVDNLKIRAGKDCGCRKRKEMLNKFSIPDWMLAGKRNRNP